MKITPKEVHITRRGCAERCYMCHDDIADSKYDIKQRRGSGMCSDDCAADWLVSKEGKANTLMKRVTGTWNDGNWQEISLGKKFNLVKQKVEREELPETLTSKIMRAVNTILCPMPAIFERRLKHHISNQFDPTYDQTYASDDTTRRATSRDTADYDATIAGLGYMALTTVATYHAVSASGIFDGPAYANSDETLLISLAAGIGYATLGSIGHAIHNRFVQKPLEDKVCARTHHLLAKEPRKINMELPDSEEPMKYRRVKA